MPARRSRFKPPCLSRCPAGHPLASRTFLNPFLKGALPLVMNALTHVLQVLNIALAELMPDPSQPRKTFLDEEIQRLAASIAARGVLQPLRVMWDEQRQVWVILTGESRFRAAKLAGLASVPCLPVAGELSEADKLADRLTENDVRHDLEPMEAARALARLKALKGCTSRLWSRNTAFPGPLSPRPKRCCRCRRTFRSWSAPVPARSPRRPPMSCHGCRLKKARGACPGGRSQASVTGRRGGNRPGPDRQAERDTQGRAALRQARWRDLRHRDQRRTADLG